MLCVLSYFSGDQDQAERLSRWILDLGGCKGHELLLIQDADVDVSSGKMISDLLEKSFGKVEVLIFSNPYTNLPLPWPRAANKAFQFAANHIQFGPHPQPWLWIEPDVVPMKADWIDALSAEYQASGNPFLGDFVSVHSPEMDVPDHMSGVGIYPGNITIHAGIAMITDTLAWDVAAASQILPKMHKSKLILHSWKHQPFDDWEQVEREIFAFKPECVLFHADKSGSLIQLLREHNLSGGVKPAVENLQVVTRPLPGNETATMAGVVPSAQPISQAGVSARTPTGDAVASPANLICDILIKSASEILAEDNVRKEYGGGIEVLRPELMKLAGVVVEPKICCDILIKSYPADYEWLGYCLRSIEKFATGFRRIVLVIPKMPMTDGIWPPGMGITNMLLGQMEENGDGYLVQQTVKAAAHEWTDADYVMHIDSDTVLTEPVTPQTFFRDGKPYWIHTPYGGDLDVPWKPITEKFMLEPVEFEFMRRTPTLMPRFLHLAISEFCQEKHGMRLTDYILSQPNREFSEFNALGAVAYSRHRDRFTWLNTEVDDIPEPVAIQSHSWSGLTPELRAQFESILSGAESPARENGAAQVGCHSSASDSLLEPIGTEQEEMDKLRKALGRLYSQTGRALRKLK